MAATTLSPALPLGTGLNERGRLEVGGCDLVELAREFGTPAYVYAVDDLRARARAYLSAFAARRERFEVLYASKACPATPVMAVLADEGLSVDVASGGELFLALRAGFAPERVYMHGNNKTEEEIAFAAERGVGHFVVDSFDEIERLERIAPGQPVLLRVTPGIQPETHAFISTGQADSKFGFGVAEVPRAIDAMRTLRLDGLHAHIGSQILSLEPFRQIAGLLEGLGEFPLLNVGGGLGIAYGPGDEPPSVDSWAEAVLEKVPERATVLSEPGRSLVGNAGVTIYTVGTVKEIEGIRTYVSVNGGMSDNLRPMLYGARYFPELADRPGGETLCTIAGMHCESGDILARDVRLADPKPGDVLVMPATGAYGHAMSNNYNALRRPPIVFCSGGDAREVVRRESYEDLALREL